MTLEPPADLRDLVWTPATITWVNGGKVIALLPGAIPASSPTRTRCINSPGAPIWSMRPRAS